ncbi:hypothetical protein VTN00DRAFT_3780 [Thermoascus crustaceus]|uniref:uncharacterized protein n=1 Tax=Thermoascus crustaceus TaxID=5088 RepID=UPI0037434FF6
MVRDMAVTAFTIKKLSLSTMQSSQYHPVTMVGLSAIMLGHPEGCPLLSACFDRRFNDGAGLTIMPLQTANGRGMHCGKSFGTP